MDENRDDKSEQSDKGDKGDNSDRGDNDGDKGDKDDSGDKKKPFKIKDITRDIKKAVCASSLDEMRIRVAEIFGYNGSIPTIHYDGDGTEIDDEEYFATLESNAELIAVFPGERWIEPTQYVTITSARENERRDEQEAGPSSGERRSRLSSLVGQLQSNLCNVSLTSDADMECLSNMDPNSLTDLTGRESIEMMEISGRSADEAGTFTTSDELLGIYRRDKIVTSEQYRPHPPQNYEVRRNVEKVDKSTDIEIIVIEPEKPNGYDVKIVHTYKYTEKKFTPKHLEDKTIEEAKDEVTDEVKNDEKEKEIETERDTPPSSLDDDEIKEENKESDEDRDIRVLNVLIDAPDAPEVDENDVDDSELVNVHQKLSAKDGDSPVSLVSPRKLTPKKTPPGETSTPVRTPTPVRIPTPVRAPTPVRTTPPVVPDSLRLKRSEEVPSKKIKLDDLTDSPPLIVEDSRESDGVYPLPDSNESSQSPEQPEIPYVGDVIGLPPEQERINLPSTSRETIRILQLSEASTSSINLTKTDGGSSTISAEETDMPERSSTSKQVRDIIDLSDSSSSNSPDLKNLKLFKPISVPESSEGSMSNSPRARKIPKLKLYKPIPLPGSSEGSMSISDSPRASITSLNPIELPHSPKSMDQGSTATSGSIEFSELQEIMETSQSPESMETSEFPESMDVYDAESQFLIPEPSASNRNDDNIDESKNI